MTRRLRTPDSGCGDIQLGFDGLTLSVDYEYTENHADLVGRLLFRGVIAYRYHGEMHSHHFAQGSFDTVVEIRESSWLDELRKSQPEGVWGTQGKKHFAVFLSNNGYLEAIADSCDEADSRSGTLADSLRAPRRPMT